MNNTKMELSININSVLPTESASLAERILLNRLRIALRHCTTLRELDQYFSGSNSQFNYSVQNEAVPED